MLGEYIRLNFISLLNQNFKYKVWRFEYKGEKKEGFYLTLYRNSLPTKNNLNDRKDYWISFKPIDNFEEFFCQQNFNHILTRHYLFTILKENVMKIMEDNEYFITEGYRKRIYFVLSKHNEGRETIWLEPYYLSTKQKFGFLIDFKFIKNSNINFSREIQRLSLSLDKNYRSNRNFYIDKFQKINDFLNNISCNIFPLTTNLHDKLNVSPTLEQIAHTYLDVKQYMFANDNISSSQYRGLEIFGPLEPLNAPVTLLIVYLKENEYLIKDLVDGLYGKSKYIRFSGMNLMFKLKKRLNIEYYSIQDFSDDTLKSIINFTKQPRFSSHLVLPILIIEKNKDDEVYYKMKYDLLKENLPLQVITSQLLRNKESLKWSVANISLQIFAKLGGKPWKVTPSSKRGIIIGIGQSHQKTGDKIRKYFAYSVCTDSSGIYKKIGILGHSDRKEEYFSQLSQNILEIVNKYTSEGYKSIVFHVPFRIRREELEVMNSSIQQYFSQEHNNSSDIDLIVLRINQKNKYFGYANTNSLVPYESSLVLISNNPPSYLVWFEGLQYHRNTIIKRIPGPVFVEFYWSNKKLEKLERKRFLQDLLNLSGANWRGFNAKNLPISIYYCQLIAKFLKKFPNELENISNLRNPWFL